MTRIIVLVSGALCLIALATAIHPFAGFAAGISLPFLLERIELRAHQKDVERAIYQRQPPR